MWAALAEFKPEQGSIVTVEDSYKGLWHVLIAGKVVIKHEGKLYMVQSGYVFSRDKEILEQIKKENDEIIQFA
ncbi:MAG: hypothetical protein D6746_10455 [Bacteroidetes bacterium]|nr:MAG: hypothetical protein D6746_10455 [Bacteroidota bacterium]